MKSFSLLSLVVFRQSWMKYSLRKEIVLIIFLEAYNNNSRTGAVYWQIVNVQYVVIILN